MELAKIADVQIIMLVFILTMVAAGGSMMIMKSVVIAELKRLPMILQQNTQKPKNHE